MQSEDPLSDRLRAESIILDFLDGAADPAVVASFTTAEPVDALATRICGDGGRGDGRSVDGSVSE